MSWSGGYENQFGTQNTWPDGTTITGRNANQGNNATVRRTMLRELSPGMPNTVLVGVVITKQSVRSFPSKKNIGTENFLMSFTLRDTPTEFINATCWGNERHIRELSNTFKIGDIIEVQNPHVQSKPPGELADKYGPWTPLGVEINISETRSTVVHYSGWDFANFNSIQHIPVKESNDYYTLADVITNGQNLHGQHINLLALVREMGIPKDLVTKTGRQTKRCEIKLLDETCPLFTLMFWDEENIEYAQTWNVKDTVIFAADVRVSFDDFRKTMIATVDSKTIFTVNPDTREAHSLYTYGKTYNFEEENLNEGSSAGKDPELANITDVYTIQQVKNKFATKSEFNIAPEYGIIYALISSMNIDAGISTAVSVKCSQCKFRIDRATGGCKNRECPASVTGDVTTLMSYDVLLSVSDHTGTYHNCRLSGSVAEMMFGYPIFQPHFDNQKPILRILSCNLADPYEAVKYIQ
ncbi:meiosis-specific with OB domain-containing protein-like [Saccoglossus kowalevskii]